MSAQVDICDYPCRVSNFIRQVVHQFRGVLKANESAFVVPADHQYATLRVGESGDTLQIFIPPFFLPFDVLAFQSDLSLPQIVFTTRSYFSKRRSGVS